MEVPEYIAALQREGLLLAVAAATAGPDAPVPSCPGWLVRDLLQHLGGVHRWATAIVSEPRTGPWLVDLADVVGTWPADADLLDWFAEGHAKLIDALATADPALECWTFLAAPSPLAMWARRQAHETAMHRVDADLAASAALSPLSAAFAADGIDELLSCFIVRPGGRLRAEPSRTLLASCHDAPGGWLVRIGADEVNTSPAVPHGTAADCWVSGRAADLYLALWSRADLTLLTVTGHRDVLDLFLDAVHIRWD